MGLSKEHDLPTKAETAKRLVARSKVMTLAHLTLNLQALFRQCTNCKFLRLEKVSNRPVAGPELRPGYLCDLKAGPPEEPDEELITSANDIFEFDFLKESFNLSRFLKYR